ncbi:nuclear transport factor 2 family protein [Mangrovimicrobium sediminis]|uniref:Nuclear transport factor 2 family protein n=1 Tax=Mangrovimicrobium sediminis TaxID=2562682 RepID=A0A4Z0LWC3_9GAMM|nr:nuclear transport factor 2 family protein [Haliea sp. SAOS-164]TGD71365.1 nuclear transport factor 2 family protein [Haliea sp. SAOS-164]
MNDNEALMRRFLGYWATREWDAMADMFAVDGVYDNVPEKKPMVGREAVREWLKMVFAHLTRIDVEVLNIACNGEWLLAERIDTHVMGDKHMPLPVMNATRIVDGEFVMFRDYYCRKTVAELGMG